MASVASGGTADRIAARTLFKVLRAGSGMPARYSSTSFEATLAFAAGPRSREFAFFIRVKHGTSRHVSYSLLCLRHRLDVGACDPVVPAQSVLVENAPEIAESRGKRGEKRRQHAPAAHAAIER